MPLLADKCDDSFVHRDCISCCPPTCTFEKQCLGSNLHCLDGCYCPDGKCFMKKPCVHSWKLVPSDLRITSSFFCPLAGHQTYCNFLFLWNLVLEVMRRNGYFSLIKCSLLFKVPRKFGIYSPEVTHEKSFVLSIVNGI